MRVLFVNSVCAAGSTGRIFASLCRLLKERGEEALLCYGRGSGYRDIHAERIGSDPEVFCHVCLNRLTDHHEIGSKHATRQLIRHIEAWNPDIVHLGNIHGYYLNIPLLMEHLKRIGVPILWTLHDCWSFTGHCSHFTDVGCERWITGCHHCPKRHIYPSSIFFDRSRQVFDIKKRLFSGVDRLTIVTPSEWLAGCVRRSFLNGYPVAVLPNGIDTGLFSTDASSTFSHKGKRLALGVAVPWDKRKGFDDFIALRKLLPEDWTIALVGVTEKQRRMLPEGIVGVCRTENAKELAGLYAAADVYVNPTYCDTFPTTNLEALACGTPVVTYDVGGSPESITKETGRVVKMGDVAALAEKTVEAAETVRPEDCRERAMQYDQRDRFAAYLSLYESVLR